MFSYKYTACTVKSAVSDLCCRRPSAVSDLCCRRPSAVSDLCCRRPSTVSDRFSVHQWFHKQTDLCRVTICCARPATSISCTVAAFKSAVSDLDPGSVRCETVLASALSTARCKNALSCKCDRLALACTETAL